MLFRFAYGHLIGKCRRKILLEYFGEDSDFCSQSSPCCDVCESPPKLEDYSEEIKAVIQAVEELPASGEKKVSISS